MLTEQYSVVFNGFNTDFYTTDYIANIWGVSANEVYEETGIYIPGIIHEGYLVDEKIVDGLGKQVYMVVSTRNPTEPTKKEDYWDSYREVIRRVRGRLESPSMSISKNVTDFYYFLDIEYVD